jgi:hypothetical protein
VSQALELPTEMDGRANPAGAGLTIAARTDILPPAVLSGEPDYEELP